MTPFVSATTFLAIFIFPLSLVALAKRAHNNGSLLWPGLGLLFCSFAWWRFMWALLDVRW